MAQSDHTLYVIAGPTAVGKSALALKLATKLQSEIVSADSRQIYRRLNIGTAKPTPAELQVVPHHFVNYLDLTESYSAARYGVECRQKLDELFSKHQSLILCGGTGLYLQAILHGFDSIPDVPTEIVSSWTSVFETEGLPALQEALLKFDPAHHKIVDLNNPRRLIRALSVSQYHRRPYSAFLTGRSQPLPWKIKAFCLVEDRTVLYERINLRVEKMIERGLLDEVKSLSKFRHCQALDTVGYKEIFAHLEGQMDLISAVDQIKVNTRRYAKRQMTWFRKYGNWQMTEASSTTADNLLEGH